MIKRFFLSLSLSLTALLSYGQSDFVDGIKYTVIDAEKKLCEVSPHTFEYNNGARDHYQSKAYKGEVVIPEKVTIEGVEYTVSEVGYMAFRKSEVLHVQLPNTIKKIGLGAFHESRLQDIRLPESVEEIESGAFQQTTFLDEVIMGNNVTKLGDNAFYDCPSLKRVVLSKKLKVIEKYTFCKCYQLEEVVMPTSLTQIDMVAFGACENLLSLTMPPTLKSVGQHAFYKCYKLDIKNMPSTAKVDAEAYLNCGHQYNVIKKKWAGRCSAEILNKVIEVWRRNGKAMELPIGTPLALLQECERVMEAQNVYNGAPYAESQGHKTYFQGGVLLHFTNGKLTQKIR